MQTSRTRQHDGVTLMEKTAGGPLGCEISDCKQGATPPSRRPPRGKLFQEFGRSSRAEPEVNSPRPPPLLGPRRVGVRLRQPPAPTREWRPLPGMLRDARAPRGTGGAGGVRCAPVGPCTPGRDRAFQERPEGTRCDPAGPRIPGANPVRPCGAAHARKGPCIPGGNPVLPAGAVHARQGP